MLPYRLTSNFSHVEDARDDQGNEEDDGTWPMDGGVVERIEDGQQDQAHGADKACQDGYA